MRHKKIVFAGIALIMVAIVVEAFSFGALLFMAKVKNVIYTAKDLKFSAVQKDQIRRLVSGKNTYIDFDKHLGWSIKKNGRAGKFRANAQGIRADREYAEYPHEGIIRVATFGDSFTHNDEVGNQETWQYFVEEMDPGLELMNFGVGAFGVDQAYLRYLQKGRKYHAHVVFIGFMRKNYFRHISTFRPFYVPQAGLPLAKPRFVIENDKLKLIKNPVQDVQDYRALLEEDKVLVRVLCQHDFYCQQHPSGDPMDRFAFIRLVKLLKQQYANRQPLLLSGHRYNPDAEAYQVTERLVDAFYQDVLQDGAVPVIVVFPDQDSLIIYEKSGRKSHEAILAHWQEKEYRVIDLLDVFLSEVRPEDRSAFFAEQGHYSVAGNARVARWIHAYLNKMIEEGEHFLDARSSFAADGI